MNRRIHHSLHHTFLGWVSALLLLLTPPGFAARKPPPVFSLQPLTPVQLRALTIELELSQREALNIPQELDPLLLQALRFLPPLEQQLACSTALARLLPVSETSGQYAPPSASDALPSVLAELNTKVLELEEEAALELATYAQQLLSCLERPVDPSQLERLSLLVGMAHLFAGDEQHNSAFTDLVALRALPEPLKEWPKMVQDAYRQAYALRANNRVMMFSPTKLGIPGQVWVDGRSLTGDMPLREGRHLLQVIPPGVLTQASPPATRSVLFSVVLEENALQLAQSLPPLEHPEDEALAALSLSLAEARCTPAVGRTLKLWLQHRGLEDALFLIIPEGSGPVLRRFSARGGLESVTLAAFRRGLVRSSSAPVGGHGRPPPVPTASGWSILLGGRAAVYPAGMINCIEACGFSTLRLEAEASVTPELELLVLGGPGRAVFGVSGVGRLQEVDEDRHVTAAASLLAGGRLGLGPTISAAGLLELSYGASPLFRMEYLGGVMHLGVSQLRLGGRLLLLGAQVGAEGKMRLGGSLGVAGSVPLSTVQNWNVNGSDLSPWRFVLQPFAHLGLIF